MKTSKLNQEDSAQFMPIKFKIISFVSAPVKVGDYLKYRSAYLLALETSGNVEAMQKDIIITSYSDLNDNVILAEYCLN